VELPFRKTFAFSIKYSDSATFCVVELRNVIKKHNSEEIFYIQTKIEKPQPINMKYTEDTIDNDKIEILNSI
jgi:hypothetical protein